MPDNILDQNAIDEMKSTMGDKFAMMIEFFLEDAQVYIETINAGLKEQDLTKIKAPAHTLKSSSKQLGVYKVAECSKQIEHIANNMLNGDEGSFEDISNLFEQLQNAFKNTEPELKKFLA